jgi:hypothetical protein
MLPLREKVARSCHVKGPKTRLLGYDTVFESSSWIRAGGFAGCPRPLESNEGIQGIAMSMHMSKPGIASDYTSYDHPETFAQNAQVCTRALSPWSREAEKSR